ncbi:MAG: FtsW/RodA/SpoVE family cell cycle protein [Bacteroidaceae bacterium]|nr:FtsW/RodA/SpoVE family cell cycle protein [Bacteroidaceae bacterium]
MTAEKKSRIHFPSIFYGDAVIWIVFLLLCSISIVEVYSAMSRLSYADGRYWAPFVEHLKYVIVGVLTAIVIHNVPCKWFRLYPLVMYPLSVIFLCIVLLPGHEVNGASRSMNIFGIGFQPSELGKGALVVLTALILSVTQTPKGADRHAFKYIMIFTVIVCGLIFPENLSTAGMLFIVIFLMMFIGHIPAVQMGKLLGFLAIIAGLFFLALISVPNKTWDAIPGCHRVVTWKKRFGLGEDRKKIKEITPEEYDYAAHEQVAASNIAIASSHVLGKMPGNSVQRDFLSLAFSDFIYAIIIEELGLVGGIVVLLLYLILLFRVEHIARQCTQSFPAFLILGLGLLLVIQAIVNMCVVAGIMPVTGQPLPFISKGGTSMIVNSVYIGMILSVSRYAKKDTEVAPNTSAMQDAAGIV